MNPATKIHCLQCPAYENCSPETRLYVNYCGVQHSRYHERICRARSRCRKLRERTGSRWTVVAVTHPFLPGVTGHGTLPAPGTGSEYRMHRPTTHSTK